MFDEGNMTIDQPLQFTGNGICLIPEGRGIFPWLSVSENLRTMAGSKSMGEATAEAFALFPALASRMRQTAGSLAGGE